MAAATLAVVTIKGKSAKSGGRRRNYQSADEKSAIANKLPRGWANWLGFVLFAFCAVAVIAYAVVYAVRADWADAAVALAVGLALVYFVYLFGTTHLKV